MSLFGCENDRNCTGIAVVASIIVGIITAFLQITAVISVSPVFLWVVFGIAVGYLAITLAGAFLSDGYTACGGTVLNTQLAGIVGTVLFSVILLAVDFAATSIVGAIVTGALLLFFSLTITSSACLVRCLVNDDRRRIE